MKTNISNKTNARNLFLLLPLATGFWLALACQAPAQTYTILHSFTARDPNYGITNDDGSTPWGTLVVAGNSLYGTAHLGGPAGGGAVFKVDRDGSNFMVLHAFPLPKSLTNSDGAYPYAGLVLSGDTLYGTAYSGGTNGSGAVFKVTTNGTDFTVLHTFTALSASYPYTNTDGASPRAGLVLSGDALYGVAEAGGTNACGTVFEVNTDGSAFATLHNFDGSETYGGTYEGSAPRGKLVLSGSTLYGTTYHGGTNYSGGTGGYGTVFTLDVSGSGFQTLYNFTRGASDGVNYTNSDGHLPYGGLVLSGGVLYGTTEGGGLSGHGTVFEIQTSGASFNVLHNFSASSAYPLPPNNDGGNPEAELFSSGNALYGTTSLGGTSFGGTIFTINTDGSGYTNLYNFTGGSDGGQPNAGVILSGDTLCGTTSAGGGAGDGTVFSFSVPPGPPILEISTSGADFIVSWPASATGFSLQTNGDLTPSGWNDFGGTILTNADTHSITITPSTGNLFFRLKQ